MCNGFIKLDRGITEHPDYFAEPFTRMSAWIDMLFLAAWKDGAQYVHKVKIRYKRGQAVVSVRFLSERWRRNMRTVMKFLQEWEEDGRITVDRRSTAATLVTITNYDKYQFTATPSATPSATPPNADPARDSGTETAIENAAEMPNAATPSATPSATNRKKGKNISTTTTTPERVCVCEDGFADFVADMKNDGVWRERMAMRYGLRHADIERYLTEFADDCECRGTQNDTYGDTIRHFNNWLIIKLEKQQSNDTTTPTARRADDEAAAYLRRRAVYEETYNRLRAGG